MFADFSLFCINLPTVANERQLHHKFGRHTHTQRSKKNLFNGIFKKENPFISHFILVENQGVKTRGSEKKIFKWNKAWTICEFDWMYNLDCACVQTHNLILIWYFLWWFPFFATINFNDKIITIRNILKYFAHGTVKDSK